MLTIVQRRRGRRLSYLNGGLWALGNGLVSSWLVIYIATDLGAPQIGLAVSLIRAAPQAAGLLRLGVPALIGRLASRKVFCIAAYLLSALVLAALPATTLLAWPSPALALRVLVILWCAYHLLEYVATVALWSWLAELAPRPIRGRFWGLRERWMVAGQAAGMLLCAGFSSAWREYFEPHYGRPLGYAIPAALGAAMMLAALLPLVPAPHAGGRGATSGLALRELWRPLTDPALLRLLAFGCWFSLFNGLVVPFQDLHVRALELGLWMPLCLQVAMRLGQIALGPAAGRLADRRGNKLLLMLSIPLLAASSLAFLAATPAQPFWVAGAWVLWIAWVGVNVGLPNLLLKLAPRQANAPYIATYQAITGLCMAVSTVAGGVLQDRFRQSTFLLAGCTLDSHQAAFLLGFVARSLAVLLFWWLVVEPAGQRGKAL